MATTDINNIIENARNKGITIEKASFLRKCYECGYIEKPSNNRESVTLAGGFLQTLIEQEASLLFGRFPDYEVSTENEDLKSFIYDTVKEVEMSFTEELRGAIRDYVLYGAGLLKFLYKGGSFVVKRVNPIDIIFDLDNKFFMKKGVLPYVSNLVDKLGYDNITEIDLNDGLRIFSNGRQYCKRNLKYQYTFSSVLNVLGNKVYSNLLKAEDLLRSHERLSKKMLNCQDALVVSGFYHSVDGKIVSSIVDGPNEAVKLIKISAPVEKESPLQWTNNRALIENLQAIIEQISVVEQKIYAVLGLTDIFRGRDEVNENETTVNAMDRTEKANVLWRFKQEKVNDFIEDAINKYIKNILSINNMDTDVKLHIKTNAISLLEEQQKLQSQNAILGQIMQLSEQAQGLAQGGLVEDVNMIGAFATNIVSNSTFNKELVNVIAMSFEAKEEMAVQVRKNQEAMQNQQQQPTAEEVANMQEQSLKLQKQQLEVKKSALDIKKAESDLKASDLNQKFKEVQIEERKQENTGFWAWVKNNYTRFKNRISNSNFNNQQQQIEERNDD